MGSLQAEEKQEMDDSGCIQDESPPGKRSENGRPGIQLLDLSDDVLLLILRFLTPRDLKALGYTCPRLGALILDRSLWLRVDARGQAWGRARLRWYLAHALHEGTRALLLAGYAQVPRECLSHVNQTREESEEAKLQADNKDNGKEEDNNNQPDMDAEPDGRPGRAHSARVIDAALGPNAQLFIDEQREGSPEAWAWPRPSDPLISDSTCPGPVFTLTPCALRQLADTCPALTSLALEHCNINCNTTSISQFPPTLKKLSLRGSKCYNLPLDRSFLFKIQDTLPGLEFLDVSSCEWMEPASLLPLSKLPALARLWARDCLRLTEFVAYASLATRYGFTSLQELDLRGSPVGDSEVSALGWLPRLAHLWLSPARPAPPTHKHEPGDDSWEAQEPEYFKIKEPLECKESGGQCTESSHTWRADNQNGTNSTATQSQNSSTTNPTNAPSPSKAPPSNVSSSHSLTTVLTLETPPNATSSNGSSPTKAPSQSNGTTSSPNGPSTSMASSSSPHKAPSPSNRASSRASSPNRPSTSRESSSSHSPRSSSSPSKSPKAPKRKRHPSPRPGPSKRRRDDDDSDSSDDDNVPLKCLIENQTVNEGASTSRNDPPQPEAAPAPEDREAEPRHHVLYVNVGQQLHAVYRLSLDSEHIVSFNRNSNIRRVNSRILLSPPGAHVDASSLITDSAIRRFGRADGEDINYVHIGPNGPYASAPGARPDRSSLTHLTVTGFRHITDRSLEHLATSAPHLQFLDFSETRVTDAGVAAFRSLRPDCEVRYSKYIEKDED